MPPQYVLVVFDELSGARPEFGHYPVASLEEAAARMTSPSDYVIVVENGHGRQPDESEEAEFQAACARRTHSTSHTL